MTWVLQVRIKNRTTCPPSQEWHSVRPTSGEPYRYETEEEAQHALRIFYPDQCREARLGGESVVRVALAAEGS